MRQGVADIICGITFGKGRDTSSPDVNKLLKLFSKYVANADDNNVVAILDFFPLARYQPIKSYERAMKPFFEMHGIFRKLIRERQKHFDPTEQVENFLSGLLRAKHDLEAESEDDDSQRTALISEDHFVVAIGDMFVAGYESTSTTLRWVIAFLVNYPSYQEDIQRQLDEAVANQMPSLDDRPNLPLVQAAIIEALKAGNTVPLALPHVTITDTTLCGYRVPKDTIVFANTESVHLDPKCWEDPAVFNPYRHIDTDGRLVTNQGNFFPFGAGRWVCAGKALAKVELFLFVLWPFHKFTFVPEEGYPPKVEGALIHFPSPYKVCAIKRN